MSKSLSICITYNMHVIDDDIIREYFDGYDGSGFDLMTGLRDAFFIIDDFDDEYVKSVRKTVRNLRRRKGVSGVSVNISDDEE